MKTIEEQIKVMTAFKNGAKIKRRNNIQEDYKLTDKPLFNWVNYDYIVAKQEFPDAPDGEEWYNPENLTAEQVGINDGYRLLLKSEVIDRYNRIDAQTYITKKPVGYFKQKKEPFTKKQLLKVSRIVFGGEWLNFSINENDENIVLSTGYLITFKGLMECEAVDFNGDDVKLYNLVGN